MYGHSARRSTSSDCVLIIFSLQKNGVRSARLNSTHLPVRGAMRCDAKHAIRSGRSARGDRRGAGKGEREKERKQENTYRVGKDEWIVKRIDGRRAWSVGCCYGSGKAKFILAAWLGLVWRLRLGSA